MTVYNSIEEAVKDTNAAINEIAKLQAENAELQAKIDTAIEQLNEHIHEDKHHLDDILFELEGGADSIKLELCDEQN